MPYIAAKMTSSPEGRIGPPPLSRARLIAAAALIVVTAAVASYAVQARQRADRLAAEVERLHEVERLLADSLAAARARLEAPGAAPPATAPPPRPRP